MPERTIHIAQKCTGEETAAIVAAVRAFEERLAPSAPAWAGARRREPAEGASGRVALHAAAAPASASSSGIVWKRGEASLGRGP